MLSGLRNVGCSKDLWDADFMHHAFKTVTSFAFTDIVHSCFSSVEI